MNLHGIAAGYVSAVNPMVPCSVQFSTGSTTDANYVPQPGYAAPVTIMGQVQSLTFSDLHQLDGLNLQGTKRAIYFLGDVEAIVRFSGKGGDLITTPDGSVWLTTLVLESWLHEAANPNEPGWVKIAVTLQAATLQNGA